jgi:hypothetical protein
MKVLQFRKFIRIHWLLLGLLLLAAAFFLKPENTVTAQLGEHSFFTPQTWAHDLTQEQGWRPEHPRLLADINGDHHQDVVGFGNDGTWVATANGSSFTPNLALEDFGFHAGGWRANLHVRTAGDVNGDQMDDIVGFGNAGVYRSLATGNGALGPVEFVVADFGYDQGWRNDKHVRLLADVNGDTRKDIVGFGTHGVWVSLSMSTAGDFSAPFFAVGDFGTLQGWNNEQHVRTTADVNGDTKQDIVGFGDFGVWVAFANGVGFDSPQLLLSEFAILAGGWRVDRHPRIMADVNKDTKADIVGFGYDGIWISYSTGTGFTAPQFALADFGYNQGWRAGRDPVFEDDGHAHTGCTDETCGFGVNPRFVVDLNNDGYLDVVGFGHEAIYRSLGGPNGFGTARPMVRDLVTATGGPWSGFEDVVPTFNPRIAGDVDGDGMTDLVAFDRDVIKVVRSSDQPPPALPNVPGNPRVTSSTATSLTIDWDDNSNDERWFFLNFGKSGGDVTRYFVKGKSGVGNIITTVRGDLEPNTQYCFTVQAENIFGVSAETRRVCGRTKPEAPPTPTPTPPQQIGFKQIDVLNCSEGGSVNLWLLNASNVWTPMGSAPSQLINGSCPSTAPTKKVPLPDGQFVRFVAVQPSLCNGQNDPNISSCQKANQVVFGKATGFPLPMIIH